MFKSSAPGKVKGPATDLNSIWGPVIKKDIGNDHYASQGH